ncbi:hypothetical protein [Yoonia sp. BS5-3]|uniref:Uncharacterized protein n=1 Tax=Yoonia phaeophyticola TaxID=3137369 RepID=A0ABZ2V6U5_9RHOB
MERIALILAMELSDSERNALAKVAGCHAAVPDPLVVQLRRLRLIDPDDVRPTPLGRDVLRLLRQDRKAS